MRVYFEHIENEAITKVFQFSKEDLLYRDGHSLTPNESNESLYCMQFPEDMLLYPKCYEKILWLRNGWKTHQCYADYGVDGSICSMRRYLSEIENHCPPIHFGNVESNRTVEYAKPTIDLQRLFLMFAGNAENYDYIKNRLTEYWPSWIEALHATLLKYPESTSNKKRMNIIIHLGLLTETYLHIGEKSRSGGPLGELLQWSDLIACLFLLGHNLYISNDKASLIRHIDKFPFDGPCPSKQNQLNLIITDIIGLRSFRSRKEFLLRNKCSIRLVDSFGTHVEFNYRAYFKTHQADFVQKGSISDLGGKSVNPWGGHGLRLLQHWTFFPHTPDNDFLGFAIHRTEVDPMYERNALERPISLVYGKEKYMWTESEPVIEVLKSLTEVHATVADLQNANDSVFSGIVNHGFLNTTEIASLLESASIFVGLGFPFEGPAPLEAVAHGAVFINPKFEPPKNRLNTAFFRDKPTLRKFTSQSPYMERIGKPYVYTVNFNDTDELRDAIEQALQEQPQSFVPEEFTPQGMLIRVNMLVHRDLCSAVSTWPPSSALQVKLSAPGESCEMACSGAGLVCEPSFFPLVNSPKIMASFVGCSSAGLANSTEPHAPYNCSRQTNIQMFSCATRPPAVHGANPCAKSDDGLTPLHVACAYDCLAMAQLLMHYGADPLAEDVHGRTPQSLATGNTQRFLQRMLSKSTREQRGIIRRLFACHAGMGTAANTNFMRSIRNKVRRSFNLGRRRPSLVAPQAPTNVFTTGFPVTSTQISGQAPSERRLPSSRSVAPGYPVFDVMPLPAPSKAPCPSAINNPGAPAAPKDPAVDVPSNSRRSQSDPEIKHDESHFPHFPQTPKAFTPHHLPTGVQPVPRKPVQIPLKIAIDHRPAISVAERTRPEPSAPPIEEMPADDLSKWLSEKDSTQDSQSAYLTADESFDMKELQKRLEQMKIEGIISSPNIDDGQLRKVRRLNDAQLKAELRKVGIVAGPMCARTRGMYEKKLVAMRRAAADVKGVRYSRQLEMAMLDVSTADRGKPLDDQVREEFQLAGVTAFCYLLLDPRQICVEMDSLDLKSFVPSIFYVGKGSKARPLAHLIEAKKEKEAKSPKMVSNAKLKRIDSIWANGRGVVCLQISQSVSDEEAFVREAALIEAIKLENLTNVKRGEWRGKSKSWTPAMRAEFGTYQLLRAMGVLKMEGIRPIFPQALPDSVYPFTPKKNV
ncbi:hypothetical protein GCK32_005096 [Trichostrongylus colubriformis]|uniref:alpha-1,6-mannosyl-glycoprotein 6-beta-N-acetylglucosaminyltransferase n=1 Tax=Trichostrongylus colubriformis TaxID=6319 RepID=A0AAN8IUM6_TRICO